MGRAKVQTAMKKIPLPLSISPDVATRLDEMAGKIERNRSFVAQKLINRGLIAYDRDGQLDAEFTVVTKDLEVLLSFAIGRQIAFYFLRENETTQYQIMFSPIKVEHEEKVFWRWYSDFPQFFDDPLKCAITFLQAYRKFKALERDKAPEVIRLKKEIEKEEKEAGKVNKESDSPNFGLSGFYSVGDFMRLDFQDNTPVGQKGVRTHKGVILSEVELTKKRKEE